MTKKRRYVMNARSAKADAMKERIRESAVQLYCERSLDDFTLEDVARGAETTVQTVLRVFGSKDNLIVAALERLMTQGGQMPTTTPGDIAAAVTSIFDLYETIGDLVIQRLADERRVTAFKASVQQGREGHRDWVRRVFAPQLQSEAGSARSQLLNSLIVATDVYTWKRLRRDLGLTRPAAEAVVRRIVEGVTKREKGHGEVALAELVGRRQSAS